LLDNAIKYSEPGQSVEIGATRDGDRVSIAVRDHGVGIPTRDLERIFERFYRVDRARSRDTGGTGLGLAIVRHVAQAHGGDVKVESREGEGSTFTLSLPIYVHNAPRPAPTLEELL
jgi:two-component system sensor histidine kinase SenX3